ncbi:signal peptidase I [Microbacterium sp. JB110]|uniref:signal peptidase I n=1 Tax=unclassified Microbacterium TaxID=2609290 RepID=UPI00097ECF83|nr:signal peptidase I [Microbacterium sp. JB110]SJM62928.1 Signal peptidase I [Frigoribacterium sp. JB110]
MSDSLSADPAADDMPVTSRRELRQRQEAERDGKREKKEHKRGGALLFLRDVVVIIVIAVLISFLIKTFVVRSFYIPSGSMENTLQIDDRILVDEVTPLWNEYERGEIVVFADPGGWLEPKGEPERSPVSEGIDWFLTMIGLSAADSEDHLVKRIIGTPGDHVVCCNALGQLTVNGKAIDEMGYLKLPEGDTKASRDGFDITVPDDSLWVMGDNRNNSLDSRYNRDKPGDGFVPVDNVVGRVFFRTWPFERFGWMSAPEVFAAVPSPDDE